MDTQAIRDEVYEKCIRKVQQKIDERKRSGTFGQARALEELMLSLKSMRHAEHEAQRREQE